MNKADWLTMNRLFQHSAIVLFVLCLAVVSPLVGPASAEQSDVAQRTTSEAPHCCKKVILLRHPRLPKKPSNRIPPPLKRTICWA